MGAVLVSSKQLTACREGEGAHPAIKTAEGGFSLLVLVVIVGVLHHSHQVAVAVEVAVPPSAGHLRSNRR